MTRMLRKKKRRLGLALGSGAARGLAHIGVLKVLEEEGVEIDFISGTSIGALIGALYAAGVPIEQIEEVACDVDWQQLARMIDPIIPTSGLIDGKKVSRFIAELLPVETFEELRIPLAVVATDVETGEEIIIKRGALIEALRAAVAFPGIFTPVRFGETFLVDGGLCNPVPVDVVRNMGADKVIGVCAIPEVVKPPSEDILPPPAAETKSKNFLLDFFNAESVEKVLKEIWRPEKENKNKDANHQKWRKPPGIFRVFAQCVAIMENQINALRLERDEIDILIRPDLKNITLLEFNKAEEAIRAGELATRAHLDSIRALQG